eukprot:6060509-Prymnesium_polylepis.1
MEQLEWAMEETMKINHRKNKGPPSEKLLEAQEQLAKRIDELRLDAGKVPGRPSSPVPARKVSFSMPDDEKTEPSATPRTSPTREKPREPSWDNLPMLSPGK